MIQEIASSVDEVTINSDIPEIMSSILWAIPQTAKEKSLPWHIITKNKNSQECLKQLAYKLKDLKSVQNKSPIIVI